EDLHEWFNGRVVLIGDARHRRDGTSRDATVQSADGRTFPGFVAHAIGIDALLSGRSVMRRWFVSAFGVVVLAPYLLDALAALAGGLTGVACWRRTPRRLLAEATLVAALVGGSLVWFMANR